MRKIIKLFIIVGITLFILDGNWLSVQAVNDREFPSKLLLYASSPVTPDQVYVVDPKTLVLKKLLEFQKLEHILGVYWSPDGKSFAVIIQRATEENSQLCIYTEDGVKVQCIKVPLYYPGDTNLLLWYLGNIYIPVISDNNLFQIGVVNVPMNTLSLGRIVPFGNEDLQQIRWSPNGQYIAYETKSEDSPIAEYKLHIFDIQNNDELFVDTITKECVAWSSSGKQLGFWQGKKDEPQFRVLNLSKSELLQSTLRLTTQIADGCPFAWSNDDRNIAIVNVVDRKPGYRYSNIAVVSSDGRESSIVGDKFDLQFGLYTINWSVDNQYMATSTVHDNFADVRVFSLDGWSKVFTEEGLLFTNPTWQPLNN